MDATTAKNLKSGMLIGLEQINMAGSDFVLRKKQGRDFGSENLFQIFKPDSQGNLKISLGKGKNGQTICIF